MASNLIVARGGVEYVPPISLAFWRWTVVVLLLLPFTYSLLIKNSKIIKKEFKKLFFLGATGCGVCGAFPFLAGETTTVTNMGIIYTSSPIFTIVVVLPAIKGNAPQIPQAKKPNTNSFGNSFL